MCKMFEETDETELDILRTQIAELKAENVYLRALLDEAGISADFSREQVEPHEADQGARILPTEITRDMALEFFKRFWGRTDVYAKRVVSKKTGRVGYYTQCVNFWKEGCYRRDGGKERCSGCRLQSYKKLELNQVMAHLHGGDEAGSDVIGVYPLFPDGTCRFLVFDFDDHHMDADDFANNGDRWRKEFDALREICRINGIQALAERSRSGNGAHLWFFFDKAVEAKLARDFGCALLRKGAESINLTSFEFYDRMLPMQDVLPAGGLGNLIALPLQGQALKNGNSAFVDDDWNAFPDQWKALFDTPRYTADFIKRKISEWRGVTCSEPDFNAAEDGEDKPWEKQSGFVADDVDGVLELTLSDGIYICTKNLKPRIQNRLRELAAFSNPQFFKNQAMGLFNLSQHRYIYLGSDIDDYIKLPRGLQEKLAQKCQSTGIGYKVNDERCNGNEIKVAFQGTLKDNQQNAVDKITAFDCGILQAATAFGKTVVACNVIAQKKTSTLILLESSALIDQWKEAIERFLQIDEQPPEYTTPSGRVRRRKSVVGVLQNTKDTTTGIIDIAMVGSVYKKGEPHPRLSEYGLCIIDECHHGASDTIIEILQNIKAKYVYGFTATPMRSDGLQKINELLIGPIRYMYTAKDRVKEQGIAHLVYPRFTRTVVPRMQQDGLHPNEAYKLLRDNSERDELIINDVIECVKIGRTPVVLSKYVDHVGSLYESLRGVADKVILLTGNQSKKERQARLEELSSVKADETMILLATGSLVGEGFNLPRLDTLIMATPVAWKGVVEQFAGRLNRDYPGKSEVIIYDYVDSHVAMFENMYFKRLRAYKQIGYEVYGGEVAEEFPETENVIYDIDTYKEPFHKDLLAATKEIIISSPTISVNRISEMIALLSEQQACGVSVRIITWEPEAYGFGDSALWMQLQERMRLAGFELNLVDDYCEHCCIIDGELVWYGSMNFLGKEDAEDNLMRLQDRKIAAELLERTFG